MAAVSGRSSTGPKDVLFVKWKDHWNLLNDSMEQDEELNTFDWGANQNTSTGRVARRVLRWAVDSKAKGSFGKSEYDKALNLICLFLGHHVRCKIPRPGNVRIQRDRIITKSFILDFKGQIFANRSLLSHDVPPPQD